jgi:hypothetical protein
MVPPSAPAPIAADASAPRGAPAAARGGGSTLPAILFAIAAVLAALAFAPPTIWGTACPATIRSWRAALQWPSFVSAAGRRARAGPRPPVDRGVDAATGLPLWADEDLRGFTAPPTILLGVAGFVFDVTEKGAQFYGPGAGYSLFAGRDSTRALVLGSLSAEDVELGCDVTDVDAAKVSEQRAFYRGKYETVGVLLPCVSERAP